MKLCLPCSEREENGIVLSRLREGNTIENKSQFRLLGFDLSSPLSILGINGFMSDFDDIPNSFSFTGA